MKTCDEMVNSLLKRREQYLLEQKQKRKTAAKIASAGGCCALAAVIGVGVRNSGILHEKDTIVPDYSSSMNNSILAKDDPVKGSPTPQAPDYSSVIWAEGGSDGDVVDVDMAVLETSELNGKRIYPSLSEAFDKYGDDSVFAIAASYGYGYDDNYVYNGKTLAQYKAEEWELWDKEEPREQLRKFGDSLKYGEALYLTGTPDGERWAEELYYDIVSMIGQELISEYIVNGEFLEDKLIKDINELEKERMAAQNNYEQGFIACRKYFYETAAEQINAQRVYCETKYDLDRPYLLVLFATKDEFETFSLDNMYRWCFALAQRYEDGYSAGEFIDLAIDCVFDHDFDDV